MGRKRQDVLPLVAFGAVFLIGLLAAFFVQHTLAIEPLTWKDSAVAGQATITPTNGASCGRAGAQCASQADCCSGLCQIGRCIGSTCTATGETCSTSPQCCFGTCDAGICANATTGTGGIPDDYAPAQDPIDGTTYLRVTPGQGGVRVDVDANDRYAWRVGYYLRDSQWARFTLATQGIAGSNWTNGSLAIMLPADAPASGAVIVYACKKYLGDTEYVCGPRSSTPDPTQRHWSAALYSGTGTSTCNDECATGATRCLGGNLQSCGEFDTDSCRDWSAGSPDPSCAGGSGGDNRPACSSQPRTVCASGTVAGAGARNDLRCACTIAPCPALICYQCPAGQSPQYDAVSASYHCASDQGNGTCSDECATGATRCLGGSVQACGNSDPSDTCLEWGPAQACPTGQSCQGTACAPDAGSCNSCPGWWARRCATGPDRVEVCTDADSDGCLAWATENTCASGQVCSTPPTGAVCGTASGCAAGTSNAMWMGGGDGQCGGTWGSCWDGSNRVMIGQESACCDTGSQCAVGSSCLDQGEQWWNGAYEFICGAPAPGSPSHIVCDDVHFGQSFNAGGSSWCCTSARRFESMPNAQCS